MSVAVLVLLGVAALALLWVVFTENKVARVLRLDSWARVSFDFRHYGSLRDSGLTHREAILELERMWETRADA